MSSFLCRGDVVNVVPDYAQIWTRLRENDRANVDVLYERALKIAKGAALMTGTRYETKLISGIYEIQVNRTGANIMHDNLKLLGEIEYSESEIKYANSILRETGKPEKGIDGKVYPLQETMPAQGGSTDVGDVSQVVPVIRMSATTASSGGPWHSWAVVACGGMSIGHKGMKYASKAMAMTMTDLFENPSLLKKVKEEYVKRKGKEIYKSIIPEGPPPINQN